MYNYLKQEIGDAVRDETLRRFCNQSSTNMDWLCSHGIGFGSKVYEGKRSFPPKGYDIYYSGNELSPEFEKIARPAPRGHKVRALATPAPPCSIPCAIRRTARVCAFRVTRL